MAKVKHGLPTKDDVLKFIRSASHDLSKREIAKAFNIKGDLREPFKVLLKEIEADGLWKKNTRRDKKSDFKVAQQIEHISGRKKTVAKCRVVEVLGPNEYLLVPNELRDFDDPIALTFSSFPLQPGQTLMALLQRTKTGEFFAKALKIFSEHLGYTIGVFQPRKNGGYVYPVSKKQKKEFYVPTRHTLKAAEGDIVKIEILDQDSTGNQAKVLAILGNVYQPKGLSLISILQHDLPNEFDPEAVLEADKGTVPLLGNREDLRDYDLVTIDGEDARDFDDAVFAEPHENGWHIIVAIADVAHYVTPKSALDKEAFARGNSVYFPDRVLPMLPEKLSNDLCSLRPYQDRACMAVHILLDKQGKLSQYKFVRGLMRSKARLTYNEAQHILDGTLKSPLHSAIKNMYAVYEVLLENRHRRGALDIDLPEHHVMLDKQGNLEEIRIRDRLDSHKLIEEFMIQANVCAAKALESKQMPCLYRIHDTPTESRVQSLRDFLTFIKLIDKQKHLVTPGDFNHVIHQVKDTPQHIMVSEMVLRSQQQAVYSPSNHGHFGLGLTHYAHFTSPIRRYADLIVHRSLIKAFDLGDGALTDDQGSNLTSIANHITEREKEAEAAEREVINRYLSLYMLETEQVHFTGRITSVTAFGLFVQVDETGITGMVPVSSMPDFFVYNESAHELKGRSSGTVYKLGDRVDVELQDVNVLTGQIAFHLRTKRSSSQKQQPTVSVAPSSKPKKRR
jgi:ribonuclease R